MAEVNGNGKKAWYRTGAYLGVVAMFCWFLWQDNQDDARLAQETRERQEFDVRRAYEICLAVEDNRDQVRDLISRPSNLSLTLVKTDNPEIRNVLDQIEVLNNAGTEAARQEALELLESPECTPPSEEDFKE